MQANSVIGPLGASMEDALIVQVRVGDSSYFILPQVQDAVEKAVFVVVGDDGDHVMCDHNLTEHHTVGSTVTLVWKKDMAETTVVARNPQLDFATGIFHTQTVHPAVEWESR
ncbi:hypothetical protein V7S43_015333 [Phytophthora oleae]|uniref:Uncharacterized protein n=1 Tax=Phytophthora oleae TaxID=2107226 RepID=A0ABD3EYV1_9STRA